jgi:hypothetical protein
MSIRVLHKGADEENALAEVNFASSGSSHSGLLTSRPEHLHMIQLMPAVGQSSSIARKQIGRLKYLGHQWLFLPLDFSTE